MVVKNKIPFVDENKTIKYGLKILNSKKLGVLIARNHRRLLMVFLQMVILKELCKNSNIIEKDKIFHDKKSIS